MYSKIKSAFFYIFAISATLSIIWLFTVANSYAHSRIPSNELMALRTLKTIAQAQKEFRNATIIDQDKDFTGEYALLNELSGVHKVRTDEKSTGKKVRAHITPVLALLAENPYNKTGYSEKTGFCFQVYLPHVEKPITDSKQEQKGSKHSLSINAQEKHWIAYAWPITYGASGEYCFVVNKRGKVYFAFNQKDGKPMYCGSQNIPYNAAMRSNKDITSLNWTNIATKNLAQDSQKWMPYGGDTRIWKDFFSKVFIKIICLSPCIYLGFLLLKRFISIENLSRKSHE